MGTAFWSDIFGWTSIAMWLGAQFPQVLENYRRQSCEGLALPFLFNWLMGDLTNLIGCVLTHQLPFQTILASYFCFVDMTLFSQYFYYRRKGLPAEPSPSLLDSAHQTSFPSYVHRTSYDGSHSRYRTLSNAAAQIAVTAALAADEAESRTRMQGGYNHSSHGRFQDGFDAEELKEDDEQEGVIATLADSIISEGGQSAKGKRVSWSAERGRPGFGTIAVRTGSRSRIPRGAHSPVVTIRPSHTLPANLTGSSEHPDGSNRGRPLQRQVDEVEWPSMEDGEAEARRRSSQVRERERLSSRASKRSVGMVFMGVWALFGFGVLRNLRTTSTGTSAISGRVLVRDLAATNTPSPVQAIDVDPSNSGIALAPEIVKLPPIEATLSDDLDSEPWTDVLIGRIFAWACTTLYLTSRLPQIWKNYVRKSVEGLSMYLFVFAFLGNTFYVLSILSSPKMDLPQHEAIAFIRESLPYLLGSGGTLCFDITIVTQSFLYRNPPKHYMRLPSHVRRRSRSGITRGNSVYSHTHAAAGPGADEEYVRSRSRSLTHSAAPARQDDEAVGLLSGVDMHASWPAPQLHSRDSASEGVSAGLQSSWVAQSRKRREGGNESTDGRTDGAED